MIQRPVLNIHGINLECKSPRNGSFSLAVGMLLGHQTCLLSHFGNTLNYKGTDSIYSKIK
jgi:hypothetical protein